MILVIGGGSRTGPQALTTAEACEQLGTHLGRPVHYVRAVTGHAPRTLAQALADP